VYGDLENAYLQKDVAEKLVLAQLFLKSKFPYYSLIIYDAVRPRKVQKIMWDIIQVPKEEKTKYLSNPISGSLHNYGAAVDVSIIDERGTELDMGTKYDYFGELAYPEKEEQMIKEGKLTYKQIENRKLLRNSMEQAGFSPLETEWWHFNSCSRVAAMQKYSIIE
jgi:D-alanyl-D-alanine dipeptidase